MITVINDLHIDPKRSGGSTLSSREALKEYALSEFRKLLALAEGSEHLILDGDTFDREYPSFWAVCRSADLLKEFHTASPGTKIILVRGNHDSRGTRVSDMCGLEMLHYLTKGIIHALVWDEIHTIRDEAIELDIIPHLFNQEEFDNLVARAASPIILVHANIDNSFTAQADHSLNLTAEVIAEKATKGQTIVASHEHQQRRPFPNVHVIGNQFPLSISDCLGNETKRLLQIRGEALNWVTTWRASEHFADVNIEGLDSVKDYDFVRISGSYEPAVFADNLVKIAAARRTSRAFVLKSAMKVIREGREVVTVDVDKFNVTEMLVEAIEPEWRDRLKGLITSMVEV